MDPSTRFRFETAVYFVATLGFCAAATYLQWFRTFDHALYDTLINSFEVPLAEDLLIVGIDEQSLAHYGAWPWPRDVQATLLERINAGEPRAMLVDIVYGGQTVHSADRALTDAAASVSTLALPVLIDALATDRQLIEVLPFPDLLAVTDVLGHAHVELDADAIARGIYLHQGIADAHWPHVALGLALALGYPVAQRSSNCPDTADFSLQNQMCDFIYVPFAGPPGTVPEISASDLLDGGMDPSVLTGKVVFVGITTSAAPDSITSPVSRYGRPMAGVEFNSNVFNALIQDRLIRPATLSLLMPVALACVVLPALLLPRLSPKAMLMAALSFACIPLLVTTGTLVGLQIELPLAAAAATCLLCYPYWSWRRHEIAWSFVNAEMSRVVLERSRWVPVEKDTTDDAARALGALLDATPVWYDASPAIEHDRQIALSVSDRWLVLSRQKPFTETERRFASQLHTAFDPKHPVDRLPGEMLAARIRRLQIAAQEVRLGRDIGLRGLEEMPIGVAVISALNQVLVANSAWQTLLGIQQKIEGMVLEDVVAGLPPPLGQSWLEISRAVLLGRRTVTFETQTGSGTPVVVEAAPLADTGELAEPWVITITDVTDVRVAERDREEALAFLSHDLRSPMLSVLALARSAPGSTLLDEIGRYAQRALSVSDQFLQLSRVQARETFETYDVDLLTVLDNAIDDVFHLAKDKGVRLIFEHTLGEDAAWLTGNGEMLERAFVNLLTNAIKYSNPESSVSVALSESDQKYVVAVTDRGIGIPTDDLDRIFDPYFRSTDPQLAEQRGTGLGLRFVKTVVERHGGRIQVSSRRNEGSRFTVTLPRARQISD